METPTGTLARRVLEIVDCVRPLLVGQGSEVQSAVCADLASMWLAGLDKSVREEQLALHIDTIRMLAPVNARLGKRL